MATWLALEEHEAAQRRPDRLARLPEQYFVALRRLVEAAAGAAGDPLVDLSRGNPEVGPPPHVVDALCTAAHRRIAHGSRLPRLPLGRRAGGRARRASPARRGGLVRARLRLAPTRRGRPLPQLPLEPMRGLPPAGGLRRGRPMG